MKRLLILAAALTVAFTSAQAQSRSQRKIDRHHKQDEKVINEDNYLLFCNTNETLLEGKPVGIVLEFPGLGGGSCLGGYGEPSEYTQAHYPQVTAGAGYVHAYMMPGPWSWMNPGAVRMSDLVVDAIRSKYGLSEDSPLIVSGGSMGGLGALVYSARSRHRVDACAAACPSFDIDAIASIRPDFVRTYVSAIAALDMPLQDAIEQISPDHMIREMPDIPYLIVCDCADELFPAADMDKYVEDLRAAGLKVEYIRLEGKRHGEFTPEAFARLEEFVINAGK